MQRLAVAVVLQASESSVTTSLVQGVLEAAEAAVRVYPAHLAAPADNRH